MRILVLGAGATGGYFGGRMRAAGGDVTFLVRGARAESLARDGLIIRSPKGDLSLKVPLVTAERLTSDYDAVLLSCKAYDLAAAIAAIRPALDAGTRILPVLNGIAHLEALDRAFGPERVLGGLAQISATLTADGIIHHWTPLQSLSFGARQPAQRPDCERLLPVMRAGGFDCRLSDEIEHEMWEKWVLITALAAATCLMRARLCDILATPDGEPVILGLLEEAASIADACGYPPRPRPFDRMRQILTDRASPMAASMLRDLEAGGRIEADHVLGDLLVRGHERGCGTPRLTLAYCHLKTYEVRRRAAASARQGEAGPTAPESMAS
jgi:2-dehydropantoate 2-reductase